MLPRFLFLNRTYSLLGQELDNLGTTHHHSKTWHSLEEVHMVGRIQDLYVLGISIWCLQDSVLLPTCKRQSTTSFSDHFTWYWDYHRLNTKIIICSTDWCSGMTLGTTFKICIKKTSILHSEKANAYNKDDGLLRWMEENTFQQFSSKKLSIWAHYLAMISAVLSQWYKSKPQSCTWWRHYFIHWYKGKGLLGMEILGEGTGKTTLWESGGGGALVTKSCLTRCDTMNYNPPGSSVREISQAVKVWSPNYWTAREFPTPVF